MLRKTTDAAYRAYSSSETKSDIVDKSSEGAMKDETATAAAAAVVHLLYALRPAPQ